MGFEELNTKQAMYVWTRALYIANFSSGNWLEERKHLWPAKSVLPFDVLVACEVKVEGDAQILYRLDPPEWNVR